MASRFASHYLLCTFGLHVLVVTVCLEHEGNE